MTTGSKRGPLKLAVCDVKACEAMCCHDGVYLDQQEESFLHDLVKRLPELRAKLPEDYIVAGWWNGKHFGRKTATRPHEYRNPDYPRHFARTRCVFADEQGFCELEKLGRERGMHPWTFKPSTCWLFPLQEKDGRMERPVAGPHEDPYRLPDYPGYASFTHCGRHDPAGQPWRKALLRESDYLQQAESVPILNSPGHTVDDLLGKV